MRHWNLFSWKKRTVFPVNGFIAALLIILKWTATFEENNSSCFIPLLPRCDCYKNIFITAWSIVRKKEEQLDCLLSILSHFTKLAIFSENMFDQLILKLQTTTKSFLQVWMCCTLCKKNCISSHVTILYLFFFFCIVAFFSTWHTCILHLFSSKKP